MSFFFFKRKKPPEPLLLDEAIFKKVCQIIAHQTSIHENEITPDARLINDLGIDSLDTVELTMALEEEFSVEIPDEAAEKLLTPRDIVEYIEACGK